MKRVAAIAMLIVVAAGCDDPTTKSRALPTAPVAVAPAFDALVAAPARLSGSSVCASFLRDRVRLTAKLRVAPRDTVLLTRARSLALIITDACN